MWINHQQQQLQHVNTMSCSQATGDDAPHARIIRNIRRLLTETENNPAERQKHIENMLLALPTASKV